METDEPSAEDMNTLMILVRNLLKTVPEGETPDLKQYGLDTDNIPFGIDLDTLKNVALPETGDIVVSEGGRDMVITGFGTYQFKLISVLGFLKNVLKRFLFHGSGGIFVYCMRTNNNGS